MTASWEPTSRASVQGRSSSLRNILGSGLRKERGEFWAQAGEEQASRDHQLRTKVVPRVKEEKRRRSKSQKGAHRCTVMRGKETERNHQQPYLPPVISSPSLTLLHLLPEPLRPTTLRPHPQGCLHHSGPFQRSLWRTTLPILEGGGGWTHLGSSCLLRDHGDFRGSRGGRDVRHYLNWKCHRGQSKSPSSTPTVILGLAGTEVVKDNHPPRGAEIKIRVKLVSQAGEVKESGWKEKGRTQRC